MSCEAAASALTSVFNETEAEKKLFIDASNACIEQNRQLALLNMYVEHPAMATFFTNLYRKPENLFMVGEVLLSQEGIKLY